MSGLGEQFDSTPEQKRLVEERAKHRAALKTQWQKLVSDPYRHKRGEYVFDPAMQRFYTMRASAASNYETFRPTVGNFFRGFGMTAIPIVLFWQLLLWDRKRKEELFSTGQVAYKDRMWKTYR